MNKSGGVVGSGFELNLSKPVGSPVSAKLYYMLDGNDPRMIGGGLNPYAVEYTTPICLTGDTQVIARVRDGTAWSAAVDATFDVATPPPNWLAGDYDNTGTVDSQDYAQWRQTFGKSVEPYTGADGNGDGFVDAADYAIWRNFLGATRQTGPGFSFDFIGQTYAQNFNAFRGTEATLPDYFSIAVVSGIDIYRNVFDATVDAASSFTGIKSATSDGSNFSLAWREGTGAAALDDTRVLFMLTNNTGEAIAGFNVSYDVEAWVNGRRDNQLRFKYDVYADSDESQAAAGRQAFETDIFATMNPHHTPIAANGDQFVLDGKDAANRVTVSGYVDLTTLRLDQNNPSAGVFGVLPPGRTAYFRWQISNGALVDGNRSALGIDNISITALAQSTAASGGFTITPESGDLNYAFSSLLENSTALQLAHRATLDLAIADWAPPAAFNPLSPRRLQALPLPSTSRLSNSLLMTGLHDKDSPERNQYKVEHEDSSKANIAGLDEFLAELATKSIVPMLQYSEV
jgi:hypothetical protein